ncbi:mobilization protein [Pseudomonas aeruginosa]|uniref:mobilization protein n=1 Tax=Pseudomonas aeruginosa TaxID=287 RepID=UPI00163B8862|nr:mobilization protein [Pseudomonas aeruginosa]
MTSAPMRIEVGPKKELVKRGMQPMKDSELVHAFLERVITSLEVGASGAIVQRED